MYPPQLANDLESVPIHRSTSDRSTPQYSPMPRPVSPMVPSECASSTSISVLCFFLKFHKTWKFREVTVHAVHALDGDQVRGDIGWRHSDNTASIAIQSLWAKARRVAPESSAPWIIELCARVSWRIRSSGPSR